MKRRNTVGKEVSMVTTKHSSDLMTFKEFMQYLGIKQSTMYKIMQSPYAPKFTKIGSIKLIARSAALKWIEDTAGLRIY